VFAFNELNDDDDDDDDDESVTCDIINIHGVSQSCIVK